MKPVKISARLDEEIANKVDSYSKLTGYSKSKIIEMALNEFLSDKEDYSDVTQRVTQIEQELLELKTSNVALNDEILELKPLILKLASKQILTD